MGELKKKFELCFDKLNSDGIPRGVTGIMDKLAASTNNSGHESPNQQPNSLYRSLPKNESISPNKFHSK